MDARASRAGACARPEAQSPRRAGEAPDTAGPDRALGSRTRTTQAVPTAPTTVHNKNKVRKPSWSATAMPRGGARPKAKDLKTPRTPRPVARRDRGLKSVARALAALRKAAEPRAWNTRSTATVPSESAKRRPRG